jgi:hypothetical protein
MRIGKFYATLHQVSEWFCYDLDTGLTAMLSMNCRATAWCKDRRAWDTVNGID